MNPAAPDGTPPRRISNNILCHPFAPPCLGEALRRVTSLNEYYQTGFKNQYPIRFLKCPVVQ